MSFSDILNMPLPSKVKDDGETVTESAEDITAGDTTDVSTSEEGCCGTENEGCTGSDCSTEEDVDNVTVDNDDVGTDDINDINDDFNVDDMDEDDLMELDKILGDEAVDSVAGEVDQVTLSPEEEIEADDRMSMAATAMLVNDELSAQEKADFVSSESSVNAAINEGFLTESDVNEIAANSGIVTESKYNKKMIIRLDAASKKKQLYALAVNVSAAAKHDPDYIKLKKIMKMRKVLRARLEQRYKAEATKRMKVYFKRLTRSNSPALAKIGSKLSK